MKKNNLRCLMESLIRSREIFSNYVGNQMNLYCCYQVAVLARHSPTVSRQQQGVVVLLYYKYAAGKC